MFNENAWVTADFMIQWVERIWKLYLKENSEGFASLFFMDHPSMHLKDKNY